MNNNPYDPNNPYNANGMNSGIGSYPNNMGAYPSGSIYPDNNAYPENGTNNYPNNSMGNYPNNTGMGNMYNNGMGPNMGGYPNNSTGAYSGNMSGYPDGSTGIYSSEMNQNMNGWDAGQTVYSMDAYPPTTPSNNKKKIGLVVAAIAAVAILIGCLVALTALPSDSEPTDIVSAAISRALSEEAPNGIAIDGLATIKSNSKSSFVQDANLRLKSELLTTTGVNSTVASLNATLYNKNKLSLKLSESYSGDDSLYFKIDGSNVALQEINNSLKSLENTKNNSKNAKDESDSSKIEVSSEYLECLQDTNNTRDCSDLIDSADMTADNNATLQSLATTLEILGAIDGQWIQAPLNTLQNANTTSLGLGNDIGQCATDLINNLRDNRSNLAELYNGNPFVTSASINANDNDTERSDLDKAVLSAMMTNRDDEGETSTVEDEEESTSPSLTYQVLFGDTKLNNFLEAAAETGTLGSLNSCLGQNNTSNEEIIANIHNLPNIYVELDGNLNFTKIYFGVMLDDKTSAVIGLNLSYPENITVTKPGQYKNLSSVLQNNLNN